MSNVPRYDRVSVANAAPDTGQLSSDACGDGTCAERGAPLPGLTLARAISISMIISTI